MSAFTAADSASLAIRGIIIRDDEDRIIVQARPNDVRRFARPNAQVDLRRTDVRLGFRPGGFRLRMAEPANGLDVAEPGRIDPLDYLYDRDGRPVCQVTEVVVEARPIEVTTFGDVEARFIQAPSEVDIRAVGVHGVGLR